MSIRQKTRSRRSPEDADDAYQAWQVAHRYHELKQPITVISEEMGVPRARVYELLNVAEALNYIEVSVRPPRAHELQRKLISRFHLNDCIVADASYVPRAAALYLEEKLKGAVKLASMEAVARPARLTMACGGTLHKVVSSLDDEFDYLADVRAVGGAGLQVFPVNVAMGPELVPDYPNNIVALARPKLQQRPDPAYGSTVKAYNFWVPPIPESLVKSLEAERTKEESDSVEWLERVKQAHLNYLDPMGLADHFKAACEADIFLVGIGSMKDPNPGFLNIVHQTCGEQITADKLRESAIGEVAYQIFNEHGFGYDDLIRLRTRQINIPWTDLRRASESSTRLVIAVASGREKAEVVLTSLQARVRVYNVLITDTEAAEYIQEHSL
jgi:DNA-binding transcriptional regulator LsrR (DeoR family)